MRPWIAPMDDIINPEDMPPYPIHTEDELRKLEASLENSSILAVLVKELGQTGGSDVATITKRILRRLICDEVAVLYSYTGRKGKKRAAELNTVRLVLAAVRVTRQVADMEVSHIVGEWLHFANARLTTSKASKRFKVYSCEPCRPKHAAVAPFPLDVDYCGTAHHYIFFSDLVTIT